MPVLKGGDADIQLEFLPCKWMQDRVEDLTEECVVKAKRDTRVLKTKAREGGKRTGGGAGGNFAVCRNAAVR